MCPFPQFPLLTHGQALFSVLLKGKPSDCFQAEPSHHNVHIETESKYLWISLEDIALLSITLVVLYEDTALLCIALVGLYEEPPAFPCCPAQSDMFWFCLTQ